jgi:hypothetical protein
MSLTVCLLTRNAVPHLETALRSVVGLGAEVIVADTGSTDGTGALAERLGATVLTIDWQRDFAAAQNAALDRASGAWILWLNPDEELLPIAPEPVAALLSRADLLAYGVRVLDVMRSDEPERTAETWQLRLYRNEPDARYVGRLHPHFRVPLEELARQQGRRIEISPLTVRRHGYLSKLTEDKLRWALGLLELELRDRPGQLHYLIEYGDTLLRLNDPRGHEVLAEAAEQVLAARDAPAPPVPTVAQLLAYVLTVAPEQSRSRLSVDQAGTLAQRWFPSSPPLLWLRAQRSFQAGAFATAAELLERLVALGRSGTYDRTAAFDPSIMAEDAVLNLARCYVRLGDDRAEACLMPLLQSATHAGQARSLLDHIRAMRGQQPR